MKFKFFTAQKPRVFSPLVGDAEHVSRECGSCKIPMQAMHRNEEKSSLPWRERGIDYKCENCDEVNFVANSNSVSIAVGIAIVIFTLIGILLANGLLQYVVYSLQTSIVSVIISLIAIAAVVIGGQYAWVRVKRGAELIEGRFKHPLVNRKPGINLINLSLTVGLLPWLIVISFGYLNNSYHLLEGAAIWFILPITLIPIFMGRMLGSTKMNILLATLFWLFVGSFIVWLAY